MSVTLHPDLDPRRRRELFEQGNRLFNQGDYFECHEAWEEIWRSTTPEPRDLFQGLIQIGVGLFHYFERHRPRVALRVLAKGCQRLRPFAPRSHGLDIENLLASVSAWQAWLLEPRGDPPPAPRLRVLDPERVR